MPSSTPVSYRGQSPSPISRSSRRPHPNQSSLPTMAVTPFTMTPTPIPPLILSCLLLSRSPMRSLRRCLRALHSRWCTLPRMKWTWRAISTCTIQLPLLHHTPCRSPQDPHLSSHPRSCRLPLPHSYPFPVFRDRRAHRVCP